MKIQSTAFTVMAALLVFCVGLFGNANAARKVCDDGTFPPCDDSGSGTEPPDYGDLIFLLRDDNGVPIPSDVVPVTDPETGATVDGGLCWQPIAFNVGTDLCPAECVVDTDPETVSVNQFNCGVGAIDEVTGLTISCSNCTQEVDFGRVNVSRAPAEVFERQLEDVVVNLAIADCTTLDPAGRMVATRVVVDNLDPIPDVVSSRTIDSPLQNLAIYRQLMLTGTIGVSLPQDATVLDTAARGLGVSSDKTGEVNVDLVAYLNSIMGLSDPATPTILGKLCEEYREEVQGTIQLVEKCYLNYGPDDSDILPTPVTPPADYLYTRSGNFSTDMQSLPLPAYIPTATSYGWFEHLAVLDPVFTEDFPSFQVLQGPILDAVFPDTDPGAEPPFVDFDGGNIGAFAQASDDTRAVINFMHDWPIPDADFYATKVPCEASGETAYDVSISEESGLQVPVTYINGTDREFIVTVANAGPDAATGTVTVTAVETNGAAVPGSPWVYEFTDLGAGFSASFAEPFMIDLGTSTTINWTATVEAEFDVNPLNNTVTATTSVKNTGGGGGNGGQGGNPNN